MVDVTLILLLIVQAPLALGVGYLLFLTLAALFAPRATPLPAASGRRFALLVPAHNEERLLGETLASVYGQDYPRQEFEVYVVADNCTDATAQIARQAGAVVMERTNRKRVGKGYALNWLLERGLACDPAVDALVILDADTIVHPQFLRVMDARLARGERAIQGYYAVRDPDRSWSVALRYAALAVLHYLRPLGRSVLGGTTGLKGNGMCFDVELARGLRWSGSLTEDVEYHAQLVLAGGRVTFAPDAVIEAEMPGTLRGANTQNVRWERGRIEVLRAYGLPLLRAALRQRRFAPLDAAIEAAIPPTTVLAALLVVCALVGAGVGLLGGPWIGLWIAAGLLTGLATYLIIGLWLARAPARVWWSLLYAPVFALWKLGLYVRVLLGRDRQGWVRTQR